MRIDRIQLKKFKRIDDCPLNLSATNVLVGGNNSGKSSILQGIHFTVCAAIASRSVGRDTFPQSSLLYCPAENFVDLRHGAGYLNQSNFSYLSFSIVYDNEDLQYTIRIYRGRNEGNVGCSRSGSAKLHSVVGSAISPFSIYVPGLAGIPQREELRSESVIRRGVAGGDANLFLRNVLLLIKNKGKLDRLNSLTRTVFPGFFINISFNEVEDIYITVEVSFAGRIGVKYPLELCGTGVLQALQIFSYVTLFEPSLLLLDEPDSHLHPDNQALLATTLQTISLETETQVILSTHSRHLLESLKDEAEFVWLKNGAVVEQGIGLARLPLLLDLGALDSFDRLQAGQIHWVVLTEDSKLNIMKLLLTASGFDLDDIAIYSYKSSTNLESALALCDFILSIAPATNIIIHRDRDFMLEEELENITRKINSAGAYPFITQESDMESYFLTPQHIASLLDAGPDEIEDWLNELARTGHNALSHSYIRKRDEIKILVYRANRDACPSTERLLGDSIPLEKEKRLGKTMLKLVRANSHDRFGQAIEPISNSQYVECPELKAIRLDALIED